MCRIYRINPKDFTNSKHNMHSRDNWAWEPVYKPWKMATEARQSIKIYLDTSGACWQLNKFTGQTRPLSLHKRICVGSPKKPLEALQRVLCIGNDLEETRPGITQHIFGWHKQEEILNIHFRSMIGMEQCKRQKHMSFGKNWLQEFNTFITWFTGHRMRL